MADPFRLGDVFNLAASNSRSTAGNALTTPGDTLYLRGGVYAVATFSDGASFSSPALRPAGSGASGNPITIRSYPGEIAVLVRTSGKQPLVGSSDGGRSYITVMGLDVRSVSGTMNSLIQHYGAGTGNRIDYCALSGEYVATGDNHEGIEINGGSPTSRQDGAAVTFCRVGGFLGLPGANSAGLKSYFASNLAVEDCWFFNNTTNAYNKAVNEAVAETNINAFWRRCLFDGPQNQILATANGGVTLEDSVCRSAAGVMVQPWSTKAGGIVIRNCLFLPSGSNFGIFGDRQPATVGPWPNGAGFYNNVVAAALATITVGSTAYQPLGTVGDAENCVFSACDHNLYLRSDSTAAPTVKHRFSDYGTPVQYTLAEMQGKGLEAASRAIPGGLPAVFSDPSTYRLRDEFRAAGRDGDTPGPHDPAAVLDITRYGPEALRDAERRNGVPGSGARAISA